MDPCFAIIDRNTLSYVALKHILQERFNHVDVFAYNSIEEFIRDSNRHFVHFFVSADMLFSNSDEFETLKHMTTVLTDGQNPHLDQSGYHILDITSSEEDIENRLMYLQQIGVYGEVQTNSDTEIYKEKLSEREKEVLRLIVKGLINKEIAKELEISLPTVIFHRNNICKKLQTRSIGKLTVYAVLSGIVSIKEI
jgi:DNA-binding NarL/FixJ family response regulator